MHVFWMDGCTKTQTQTARAILFVWGLVHHEFDVLFPLFLFSHIHMAFEEAPVFNL